MAPALHTTDILIVGAGMSGLTAATLLTRHRFRLLVIDKSWKVGGRLASKIIGRARFDYGAQFMTARDPRFISSVAELEKIGLIKRWFTSVSPDKTENPRWCGRLAMTAVAEHLTGALPICLAQQLIAVELSNGGWIAHK